MDKTLHISLIEQELSEKLDDLLIEHQYEGPRKKRIIAPRNGIGMLVALPEPPRISLQIEIYPNETEEPHFKIKYKNTTCRFLISNCEPMKAELKRGIPVPINKIMKVIKKMWTENKQTLEATWIATRPTNQNHGHQHIR